MRAASRKARDVQNRRHGSEKEMDLACTSVKFHQAVLCLISEGRLTDRLISAFEILNTLKESDLPDDELRDRFSALMAKLQMLPRPVRLRFFSRVRAESGNLAQEILSICANLARRSEP